MNHVANNNSFVVVAASLDADDNSVAVAVVADVAFVVAESNPFVVVGPAAYHND